MIVRYSSLNRLEKPLFTLCNPGSVYTNGMVNIKNRRRGKTDPGADFSSYPRTGYADLPLSSAAH